MAQEISSVVLNKFKLVKLGVEAEYEEYTSVEGTQLMTEVSKKYPFQPKDELLEAFAKLVPHLLMLCEIVDEDQMEDTDQVFKDYPRFEEKFKVTGLVVKDCGVTLIGRRILKGKKVLNLTTPFLLWETPEGMEGYSFMHTFQHHIETATDLAKEYLAGDYKLEAAHHEQQLSLDFDTPVN